MQHNNNTSIDNRGSICFVCANCTIKSIVRPHTLALKEGELYNYCPECFAEEKVPKEYEPILRCRYNNYMKYKKESKEHMTVKMSNDLESLLDKLERLVTNLEVNQNNKCPGLWKQDNLL